MSEFRNRIAVPAAIALLAAAVIAVLTLAFSRVLLAVPEAGSTILAMLLAGVILFVAGVIAATGSRLKPSQKALMGVATVSVLGMGIAGAALGVREVHHGGEEVLIAAEGIAYDTDALTFPADTEVSLVFENLDNGIPHDVDIYPDDTFTPPQLFDGETFPGVATVTYTVPPLEAGTYAFKCSIHPAMAGTLTVGGEGAEGGGHGEAPSGEDPPGEPHAGDDESPEPAPTAPTPTGPEIVVIAEAQDGAFAFATDTVHLPADEVFSLTLDNRDNVPHNFSILTEAGGEFLFQDDFFNGPAEHTYTVGPLEAGEYYFQCDVHPQMNGTAIVA